MENGENSHPETVDLDDYIELEETEIVVHKTHLFETVRPKFVKDIEQIIKNTKPNSNLRAKLRDAASSAKHANKEAFIADLIESHKKLWSGYIKSAVREAREERERKKKMFDEMVKEDWEEETEVFRKSILNRAVRRCKLVEDSAWEALALMRDFAKNL